MTARLLVVCILLLVGVGLGALFLTDDGGADGLDDTRSSAPSTVASSDAASTPSNSLRPDGPSYATDSADSSRWDAAQDEADERSAPASPAARAKPKLGDSSIRGRIRERVTGRGVAGATVALAELDGRAIVDLTATSAADGAFVLDDVPSGDLLLCVRIADARSLVGRRRVTLAPGRVLDVGDLDAIAGASIRGRAVEAESGAPTPDARIVAFQPDALDSGDAGRHMTNADAAGQFELRGPFGPGPVYLSASAPGRKTRAPYPSLHIAAGIDVADVVVPLARSQDLRGFVFDEDRRGVLARVELVGQGRRACCFDTDATGSFTIADVAGTLGLARPTPTTEIQIRVDADACVPLTRTLRLEQLDDPAPVELRVERGASLSGRCVDVSGAPLRNARVRLYPPTLDRHARLREATTRADGSFAFAGLEPGEFALEAESTGKLAPQPRRTLVALEARTARDGIELVFTAGLAIAGSASTDAFEPLADRIVTLHHAEWLRPRVTRTGGDGSFRFDAVPEGAYALALRGHDLRERRVPVVLREVAAGTLDNRFVVHEEPADGRIALRLVDATDGTAVTTSTQVRFVYAAFGYPQDVTLERRPDATGALEFDRLERAEYALGVSALGYAPATVRCVLDDVHREATTTVLLDRPVPLFGVVTDGGGLPIQDARVRAFTVRVEGAFTADAGATTDAGGRFHLADAPKDATVICAIAPGFAPGAVTLDANAKLLGARILLRPGARIEGTASYGDGTAARDVIVQLDGSIARQFATTDEQGRFVFEDVEDGSFVLALPSGDELGAGTIDRAQGLVLAVEIPTFDDV